MTVKIKDVTDGFIKEIEALKAERDALSAQNKILLDALNLALPSVETCYKQDMATWETLFLLREAAKATPPQCLRDVQADAAEKAIQAVLKLPTFTGQRGDWLIKSIAWDKVLPFAKQYAESVRQGGA